ncbi:MAG: hypothetical protein ABFC31_12185 [Clostridiaceae bacterium]
MEQESTGIHAHTKTVYIIPYFRAGEKPCGSLSKTARQPVKRKKTADLAEKLYVVSETTL